MRLISERWEAYGKTPLDLVVTEHEDMIGSGAGALEEYNKTGLSALQVISEALLASGRSKFDNILDLPCGGGRVTRHLRAFFPDSQIFVADIDKDKETAVAKQFDSNRYYFSPDFDAAATPQFDLIFLGSLLTHFDRDMFERALDYFIASLRPSGVAVLTVHGRTSASHSLRPGTMSGLLEAKIEFVELFKILKKKPKYNIDPERAIDQDFRSTGFGYFASPAWTEMYKRSYGGSYTSPAWIMEQLQSRNDCLVLGYKEVSYDEAQDVVSIIKI